MINEHEIITLNGEVICKITVNSGKYGIKHVLISAEDVPLLKSRRVFLYSTKRHTTIYARVQIPNGKSIAIQRFILNNPVGIVDHIDGDGLNNTRPNLRETTATGNNCNAKKRRNARTSGYKGVHKDKWNRWKAQIQYSKVKYHLGCYATELEAAKAYNAGALKYHGEYARLNDITEETK